MRRIFFFSSLFLLVTHASSLPAAEWPATVSKVINGDTLQVIIEGKQVVVALSDIDAPELEQPFGPEAKQLVEDLALHQKIKIIISPRQTSNSDKIIAEIFVPQKQDSLNRTLVREGLAWAVNDQKTRNPFELASEFARKRHLGIWSVPNPLPPWKYKEQESTRRRMEKEIAAEQKALLAQMQREQNVWDETQKEVNFSTIIKKIKTWITETLTRLINFVDLYLLRAKHEASLLLEKIRGL